MINLKNELIKKILPDINIPNDDYAIRLKLQFFIERLGFVEFLTQP